MRRFVLPDSCIGDGLAWLMGRDHHHACHVLRLAVGDTVEVAAASGAGRWHARIVAVDARQVSLVLGDALPADGPRAPQLVLVQGLSRRARIELVLQKATELGVDLMLPAACRRSPSRPTAPGRKLERWNEIMRQATRQCGRATPPRLEPIAPLPEALERAAGGAAVKLCAHPDGERLLGWHRALRDAEGPVALAVGPEGGFEDGELATARTLGYAGVSLGPLVLRTETAALALVALAAHLTGRI